MSKEYFSPHWQRPCRKNCHRRPRPPRAFIPSGRIIPVWYATKSEIQRGDSPTTMPWNNAHDARPRCTVRWHVKNWIWRGQTQSPLHHVGEAMEREGHVGILFMVWFTQGHMWQWEEHESIWRQSNIPNGSEAQISDGRWILAWSTLNTSEKMHRRILHGVFATRSTPWLSWLVACESYCIRLTRGILRCSQRGECGGTQSPIAGTGHWSFICAASSR